MNTAVERRKPDPRIGKLDKRVAGLERSVTGLETGMKHLHDCVESAKAQGRKNEELIAENTKITQEVRDILATFRIVAAVAKWLTAVGAFFVGTYHAWQKVTGR